MALSGLFAGNERKQKEQQMRDDGRLPPGQSLTLKWPVLHEGSVPHFDPALWDLRVFGLVSNPVKLSWGRIQPSSAHYNYQRLSLRYALEPLR